MFVWNAYAGWYVIWSFFSLVVYLLSVLWFAFFYYFKLITLSFWVICCQNYILFGSTSLSGLIVRNRLVIFKKRFIFQIIFFTELMCSRFTNNFNKWSFYLIFHSFLAFWFNFLDISSHRCFSWISKRTKAIFLAETRSLYQIVKFHAIADNSPNLNISLMIICQYQFKLLDLLSCNCILLPPITNL